MNPTSGFVFDEAIFRYEDCMNDLSSARNKAYSAFQTLERMGLAGPEVLGAFATVHQAIGDCIELAGTVSAALHETVMGAV